MRNVRPKTVDLRNLRLSPEEGFVLSRVSGPTTLRELVALTGIDEPRVVAIVSRRNQEGALDDHHDAEEAEETVNTEEGELAHGSDVVDGGEARAAPPAEDSGSTTHRRLFETKYHHLDKPSRIEAA